jgi:hypothetical protein
MGRRRFQCRVGRLGGRWRWRCGGWLGLLPLFCCHRRGLLLYFVGVVWSVVRLCSVLCYIFISVGGRCDDDGGGRALKKGGTHHVSKMTPLPPARAHPTSSGLRLLINLSSKLFWPNFSGHSGTEGRPKFRATHKC